MCAIYSVWNKYYRIVPNNYKGTERMTFHKNMTRHGCLYCHKKGFKVGLLGGCMSKILQMSFLQFFSFFYHILSSIQHLESQYPLVGYNPHRPWPTGAMLKALRVNVHLDVIRFALQ